MKKERPLQQVKDRFTSNQLILGKADDHLHGLQALLGVPSALIGKWLTNPIKAIQNDFKNHPDTVSNPSKAASDQYCLKMCKKKVKQLMEHPKTKEAHLEEHHVLALRVYTSQAYDSINTACRAVRVRPKPFAATIWSLATESKNCAPLEQMGQ